MKTNSLILSLLSFLIFACSEDDDSIQPSCYQDENRQVVAVFENVQGSVVASNNECPNLYTLTGGNPAERAVPLLWTCNLTKEFQKDGLKVIYSGYLFETFENENIFAQQFEITQIQVVNN